MTDGRERRHAEMSTVARAIGGAMPARHARRVTVVDGVDRGAGVVIDPADAGRTLVGTSEACGLRLRDPMVSRRHLTLEPVGSGCRVLDLGSTNGTTIDGVTITEAVLHEGQTLRCGDTAIQIAIDRERPAGVLPDVGGFGRVLGASVAMRRLYPLCERLARSNVPVVIEGETGTGKENLAEALHEVGGRQGPFVVFDCTTVSPTLLEAELFGHERGAFTGAVASRPGVFEEADGGTLLIDEIGDLELPMQAKLLRAIDRGEVRRVGAQRSVRVDVRVIAATRRNLDREVAAGRFRDDLFHRLAITRIELPPLRDRHGDVALLAETFAAAMGGTLPGGWIARHADDSWPGNVRELKNTVARFLAIGEDAVAAQARPPRLGPTSAGDLVLSLATAHVPFAIARRRVVDDFERRYTEAVLAEHGGNVTRAAAASGIALRYFQVVKARSNKG